MAGIAERDQVARVVALRSGNQMMVLQVVLRSAGGAKGKLQCPFLPYCLVAAHRLSDGLTRNAALLRQIDRACAASVCFLGYRAPQIAVSDGEIAADLLVVEHVRLLGGVAHLFDRDRIEVGEKGFARPAYGRINHPLKQHRV